MNPYLNSTVAPTVKSTANLSIIFPFFSTGDLPLLSGGSGLMTELGRKYRKGNATAEINKSTTTGKAIILAGSCSAATLQQIKHFQQHAGKSIKIDPLKLMEGSQTKEQLWQQIESIDEDALLVYSSDKPENVKKAQNVGKMKVSQILEQTMAFWPKKQKIAA